MNSQTEYSSMIIGRQHKWAKIWYLFVE